MRKEQELVGVELLGLLAVELAEELLELMLEFVVEMGLLAERREQFTNQPVGTLEVVRERGVSVGDRHTIDTDEGRLSDDESSNEHVKWMRFSDRLGSRQLESSLPPGTAQIDSFEDGGHLGGSDLDATVPGIGEAEGAFFQSLVPERQSVAIPVEDLDPIASLVGENVEVARERVLGDPVAN